MNTDRFIFRTPYFGVNKFGGYTYRRYVHGTTIEWVKDEWQPCVSKSDELVPGEDEQCTGIRDKNGKLIYEGDIVCDRGEIKPVCDMPLVVRWSDRLCRFIFDADKIGMRAELSSIDGAESHNYEIIGNIHTTDRINNND